MNPHRVVWDIASDVAIVSMVVFAELGMWFSCGFVGVLALRYLIRYWRTLT